MRSSTFAAALDSIYTAALEPATWPSALAVIADAVGATGGMLIHNDMVRNEGFLISGRLREDLGDLYMRRYIRNPTTEAAARFSLNQPTTMSALVDQHALRRTAFHADILAAQNIADMVMLPHACFAGHASTGGIAVSLTARQADAREMVMRDFGRLTPHLVRAVNLSMEVSRGHKSEETSHQLLQRLPNAVFLLDRAGRTICTNDRATELLAEADGIGLDADGRPRVTMDGPGIERRLRAAISACLGTNRESDDPPDQFAPLRIARRSGRVPYMLWLTPLPDRVAAHSFATANGPRALLHVVDLAHIPAANLQDLRIAFDMTEMEARVASLVGRGLSTPRAAALLGLKATTIRSHLVRCFEKMEVRSQVELANVLALLART